ncbi:unnamed protein product [Arabis nemorensis]|uniref:long-chain-alcohol O-fatty-acyltransferase n=1 Tax=Arabis nemorensis TaxID=586526 RepID=A0A565CVE2_9BRAS|nr:unnamed protein product [Arabis nemorensis]
MEEELKNLIKGPLFPLPPNLTRFICFTCLPIKPRENSTSQNQIPKWAFAIKAVIFGMLLHTYDYKHHLSPIVLLVLYSLHIHLSSRLLGRRWNLMVPSILRQAIYFPVRKITERKMNSDQALFLGVFAAFLVSGAVHELIFFYFTRDMPTGEVTWFFVLHGVCTAAEVTVKKRPFARRWRISPMLSRLLTVGFVVVTSGWLFFPPLLRNGMIKRLANEVLFSIEFVKRKFFLLGD